MSILTAPNTVVPSPSIEHHIFATAVRLRLADVSQQSKEEARTLLSEENNPVTLEEAAALIRKGYGTRYRTFPDDYQSNPNVLMALAVKAPYEFAASCKQEIRDTLPASFFAQALKEGASPSILLCASEEVLSQAPFNTYDFSRWFFFAPEAIRRTKFHQIMAIKRDPLNVRYAINPDEQVLHLASIQTKVHL